MKGFEDKTGYFVEMKSTSEGLFDRNTSTYHHTLKI